MRHCDKGGLNERGPHARWLFCTQELEDSKEDGARARRRLNSVLTDEELLGWVAEDQATGGQRAREMLAMMRSEQETGSAEGALRRGAAERRSGRDKSVSAPLSAELGMTREAMVKRQPVIQFP
jgi:hypothetical protein